MGSNLQLYLGHDKHFFHVQSLDTKGAEEEAELDELSARYTGLIEENKPLLEGVLGNEINLFEIPRDVFEELSRLVVSEHKHQMMVRKYDGQESRKALKTKLLEIAGAELTERQDNFLGGHVLAHTHRMILPVNYSRLVEFTLRRGLAEQIRNSVCEGFGKELLQYLSTIPDEAIRLYENHFMEVTGASDSIDGFMFWTLAPYVHQDLKQRGLNQNESMKRIVTWAEVAHDHKLERAVESKLKHCTLGLQRFECIEGIREPLGYDERMPTHLRARLYAKQVSEELIKL